MRINKSENVLLLRERGFHYRRGGSLDLAFVPVRVREGVRSEPPKTPQKPRKPEAAKAVEGFKAGCFDALIRTAVTAAFDFLSQEG